MDIYQIFGLQFVLSLFVFAFAARWFVNPWLREQALGVALSVLLLPHAFRHIGLSFLVPSLNADALPNFFATTAAYGDLISALLAILALLVLQINVRAALPFVWVFNIVGTVDLINALRQAEAVSAFGATWFIPTFIVPLLLVTHVMIFVRLLRRETRATA